MFDGYANPEDTSEAADEIERLRGELSKTMTAAHNLLKFLNSSCSCRRNWICHKCEAVNTLKSISGE
jgi:hypothetical protein